MSVWDCSARRFWVLLTFSVGNAMADRPSAFEAAWNPDAALEANKAASETEAIYAAEKAKNNKLRKRHLAKKAAAEALAAKKESELLATNAASQERYSEAKAIEAAALADAAQADAALAEIQTAAFVEKAKTVAPFAIGGLLIAAAIGAFFMFRR